MAKRKTAGQSGEPKQARAGEGMTVQLDPELHKRIASIAKFRQKTIRAWLEEKLWAMIEPEMQAIMADMVKRPARPPE